MRILARQFSLFTLAYGTPLDPRPYLSGIARVYGQTEENYHGYLLGVGYRGSLWYYYLAVFVLKTPAPTLILLALALAVGIRRDATRAAAVYLLVPPLLLFTVSCFDSANLGVRRILPAYPFLLIYAAQSFRRGCGLAATAVACGCTLWLAAELCRVYPQQIAYFNSFAGGADAAPHLLDESNVDWEQDLPALARSQARHAPAETLRLGYFGSLDPAMYGIRSVPATTEGFADPPSGIYALSAHMLAWLRKLDPYVIEDIDWLTRYEPIARIGYSIYIYRIP